MIGCNLTIFSRYVEMTAVMQKIQEDAKKKEDEKWERKREVQVKKIKDNGIYDKVSKEWELEKETNVNSEVLLIKSSGIILIFLPAFYLIIWPMTHQRIC